MKSFSEIRFLFARVCVLAAMLGIAAAHAGAPDSKQPDAATVARAHAAFHKYMSSHRPIVRSNAVPVVSTGGVAEVGSFNWSGFADVEAGANTVSAVSAEWVIPQVECLHGNYKYQDAVTSNWIGIDGFTDGTVEQLGTATQCFEGVAYYYVWYEMFPAGTIEEGTVACINNNVDCPQAGDVVRASINVAAGGNYTLALNDFTRPQESFSVTAPCDPTVCLNTSAEWIVERSAYELPFGPQFLTLVDFFESGFLNGTVTSGGKTTKIEGFTDGPVYDIAMIDDSESYFLDCVGQKPWTAPAVLLIPNATTPNGCPPAAPVRGSFGVAWDSSY
jgi:hypothetical protein